MTTSTVCVVCGLTRANVYKSIVLYSHIPEPLLCYACAFGTIPSDEWPNACGVCKKMQINGEYFYVCERCNEGICGDACIKVATCQAVEVICRGCWDGLCIQCRSAPVAIIADQYVTDGDATTPRPFCATCLAKDTSE